jgi:hypothetical protein
MKQIAFPQIVDEAKQPDLQPEALVCHARAVPHEIRLGRLVKSNIKFNL